MLAIKIKLKTTGKIPMMTMEIEMKETLVITFIGVGFITANHI